MQALLAFALFAQVLDPLASQQAYTTADPNNADRLGLATHDGAYAIVLVQGCDGIGPDMNVLTWPNYAIPPWLAIAPLDGELPGCIVRVEGRMSDLPCFTNADGDCDVSES